jgi:serine protease
MNESKSLSRLLSCLAAGMFVVACGASQAAPLADAPGRVIVKFKADASLARERIMSAVPGARASASGLPASVVAQRLQARAARLGNRWGIALRSGSGIDERTQVMAADGIDSRTLAQRLSSDSEVEYAVVDERRRPLGVPNDPLYLPSPNPSSGPLVGQWYLKPPQASTLTTGLEVVSSINAQSAWDITTGHSSVVVAVLDTGVRFEHPDLAGKLLPGYDMVADVPTANDGDGRDGDASDPGDWVTQAEATQSGGDFEGCVAQDSSWHGTQVSGIVGAATDNGIGMASVGRNVTVLPVRVLGKCGGYDSDIIAGMRWAAGLGVPEAPPNPYPSRVINLSLGGEGSCSQAYRDAATAVRALGVVVVASAGNGAGRAVNTPANCPGVIGVAGVRHIGTKVGFSDLGPELTIAAPGGNCVNAGAGQACLYPILTTVNSGATTPSGSTYTDSVNYSVGTSFSAPLVSGVVALMSTANQSLTPAQIADTLKATARAFPQSGAPDDTELGPIVQCRAADGSEQYQCYCTTSTCGAGMLDAAAAVRAAAVPTAVIAPSVTSTTVGTAIVLNAGGSGAPGGRTIVSYQWAITSGNSIATLSSTSGSSVNLQPTGEGSVTVALTVTDSAGASATTTTTIAVAAALASGGGGGGALGLEWLALLMAAVWALRRQARAQA